MSYTVFSILWQRCMKGTNSHLESHLYPGTWVAICGPLCLCGSLSRTCLLHNAWITAVITPKIFFLPGVGGDIWCSRVTYAQFHPHRPRCPSLCPPRTSDHLYPTIPLHLSLLHSEQSSDVIGILMRKLKDRGKLQTAVLLKELKTGTLCFYFKSSWLSELIVCDPEVTFAIKVWNKFAFVATFEWNCPGGAP